MVGREPTPGERYSPEKAPNYQVRAYEVDNRRLVPDPIVDKRDPEQMNGYRGPSVYSRDGEWLYGLYTRPGEGPFVHALNLGSPAALSIDLPFPAFRDFEAHAPCTKTQKGGCEDSRPSVRKERRNPPDEASDSDLVRLSPGTRSLQSAGAEPAEASTRATSRPWRQADHLSLRIFVCAVRILRIDESSMKKRPALYDSAVSFRVAIRWR